MLRVRPRVRVRVRVSGVGRVNSGAAGETLMDQGQGQGPGWNEGLAAGCLVWRSLMEPMHGIVTLHLKSPGLPIAR